MGLFCFGRRINKFSIFCSLSINLLRPDNFLNGFYVVYSKKKIHDVHDLESIKNFNGLEISKIFVSFHQFSFTFCSLLFIYASKRNLTIFFKY
jgi:hypothetical protein